MSEENKENPQEEVAATEEAAAPKEDTSTIKLNSLYAFKVGMSQVYGENGEAIPVTVLKYNPWVVSQVKTIESDGYEAVQIAAMPKKAKNSSKAEVGHLKAAGFENGARYIKEVRGTLPEGVQVGQRVLIDSLQKGDRVQLKGKSKGRGFAGVIKRWGHGGGPATHGSGFHRRPGSIGNRTDPGRVMPGRKLPGHFGDVNKSIPHVQVVDVMADESVVLVKGSVPGARNSIVQLIKE